MAEKSAKKQLFGTITSSFQSASSERNFGKSESNFYSRKIKTRKPTFKHFTPNTDISITEENSISITTYGILLALEMAIIWFLMTYYFDPLLSARSTEFSQTGKYFL